MNAKRVLLIIGIIALLAMLSAYAQENKEIIGRLEATKDSAGNMIYYVNSGYQKYLLNIAMEIPPLKSGMPVKVIGTIAENVMTPLKIIVMGTNEDLLKELEESGESEPTIQEEPLQKGSLYLYTGLMMGGMLAVLLLLIALKKKIGLPSFGRKNDLRNYVTANLKKGYGKEQIKKAMAGSGYGSSDIEQAFKNIK